jgi:hypothetical protein
MTDEILPDDVALPDEGASSTRIDENIGNSLKEAKTRIENAGKVGAAPTTAPCPYCGGDAFLDASHCKNCGQELVQFLASAKIVNELREQLGTSKLTSSLPRTEEETQSAIDDKPVSFLQSLRGFLHATALASLLFVVLSYLTQWGTKLKSSPWGPTVLVIGVFILCLAVGIAHIRARGNQRPSLWGLVAWGLLLGCWITGLETLLLYLLDGSLPLERNQYYELVNAVLGITFAYVAGAVIPQAQSILGHRQIGFASLLEAAWRIRFTILSAVFSLLLGFFK